MTTDAVTAAGGGTKTLSELDPGNWGTLGRPYNLVAGRIVVASPPRNQFIYAPTTATVIQGRMPLLAYSAMSNLRFCYGGPGVNTEFLAESEAIIQAALELASGVIYPMTFAGSQFGYLDRYGWLVSDPVPVDIPAGATYYARTRVLAPNNAANFNPTTGYVPLAADILAGATSLTVNTLPPVIQTPMRMKLTGAGTEVVEVIRWTGASAPFTAILRNPTVNAHTAAGCNVGQGVWTNTTSWSDRGSGANTTLTFDINTGTFSTTSPSGAATLNAGASIGDTKITIAGSPPAGTVLALDTAGNAETITIRTYTSLASPFTAYLAAPLTKNHLSGVAVAATIGLDTVPVPTLVTADYATNAPGSVILIGDSILQGTGNYARVWEGWATMALAGSRPVLNAAKSGESAQQFANNTNGAQRRKLLDSARWMLFGFGTNDIYAGRTLAQVKADATTICGWARTRGLRIAMATVLPRTTSSDGFETTGNQTEVNAGTNGLVRKQFNTWIRSGADGLCDLTLETADAAETARDSGIWKADATVGPYTVDGLHPSLSGHQLISAAINPSFFT